MRAAPPKYWAKASFWGYPSPGVVPDLKDLNQGPGPLVLQSKSVSCPEAQLNFKSSKEHNQQSFCLHFLSWDWNQVSSASVIESGNPCIWNGSSFSDSGLPALSYGSLEGSFS